MTPVLTEEELFSIPECPQDMRPEDIFRVMECVWESPEHYMETFLVIRTKGMQLVRFKLNRTQRDLLAVIKRDWEAGVPVRIMVLKARQEGVSTFVQALFFTLVTTNPHMTMWVIAHDRESSGNLFGMSERFLDNLDERLVPMVRNRDKKRIRFDNPDAQLRRQNPGLDSRVYVDQAKNVNAGRSDTINLLHISERAFWPSEKTVVSLLQAVPALPRTIVIQETTANGVSDAGGFQEEWERNYGRENAGWRCLFFPWFIHDEYRMRVPDQMLGTDGHLLLLADEDGEMREEDLRDGVEYVNVWGEREIHRITDEQLFWRRWCIGEKCRNDPAIFQQEYPSTPQEAFVSSGRPWWSRLGMEYVRSTLTPPIATGFFRCTPPSGYRSSPERGVWREDHFHPGDVWRGRAEVEWVLEKGGDWWIWRLPEPGEEYIISVDSAEGGEDGDRAAIQVFKRRTLEQVAEFNGYMDTDLLSHQTAMVAYFYNMAFVIPEVNNTGYGFMNEFPKLYKRIYFRKNPDAPMFAPVQWVLGFKTNSSTRNVLVTRGANYVRERIVTIRSSRLYAEMLTFVKDSHGVPRASGRNHDDLVIAFLLILEMAESRPIRLEKEQREITLWDDKSFQEHIARMRRHIHVVGSSKPKFF